jgi:TonB family protein
MGPENQAPVDSQAISTNEPELSFLLPDSQLNQSLFKSLFQNLDEFFFPRKLPPLQLTSQPIARTGLDETLNRSLWSSLGENLREFVAPKKLPPLVLTSRPDAEAVALQKDLEKPFWKSLGENIHDALFPRKLPPLVLTSRPVAVREIWGFYDNKRGGAFGSTMVHIVAVALIIGGTLIGRRVVTAAPKKTESFIPLAPDELPVLQPSKTQSGGGGGGGDRDKLEAPKGRLPKFSMQQITPPAMVVRNENPKLAVEPTIVIPPEVKLATNNLPNLGDPLSHLPSGPPSNGTGSGGGIGSGSGGGVGSGEGPGFGPGRGGGTGGGVFRVGGGVSAPRAIFAPDPEYSEEARKAKFQGTVVLYVVVGPDGRPRDIRVTRSLGLGLDEKAMEAVKQWKFEPAMKDGHPVAVAVNVEVGFHLY